MRRTYAAQEMPFGKEGEEEESLENNKLTTGILTIFEIQED